MQVFFQLNPPLAEEIHVPRVKSLRDEICLTAGVRGGFNIISSYSEIFHPRQRRGFHRGIATISFYLKHHIIAEQSVAHHFEQSEKHHFDQSEKTHHAKEDRYVFTQRSFIYEFLLICPELFF